MKMLPVLKIAFDTHISSKEIPAFRSTFIQRVDPPKNQSARYPLLQFKTRYAYDAQQPLVVCLEPKPRFIRQINQSANWQANINGRKIEMKVAHAKVTQFRIRLLPGMASYQIFNYQALNEGNYQQFLALPEKQKQIFLTKCIRAHILSFAQGIQWEPKGKVSVTIKQILRKKYIPYQGFKPLCFDLAFCCNVFLPEYIGLGKGVNKGFGVVRR